MIMRFIRRPWQIFLHLKFLSVTEFEFDDGFWREVKEGLGYFKFNNRVEDFSDLLLALGEGNGRKTKTLNSMNSNSKIDLPSVGQAAPGIFLQQNTFGSTEWHEAQWEAWWGSRPIFQVSSWFWGLICHCLLRPSPANGVSGGTRACWGVPASGPSGLYTLQAQGLPCFLLVCSFGVC